MELLLGSGKIYDFLAEKINTNYPKELIQIGPECKGPAFEGVENYWYPLNDELSELQIHLRHLQELRKVNFGCIYFCIPGIPAPGIGTYGEVSSYYAKQLFNTYLIPYIVLINALNLRKTRLITFCELPLTMDFEIEWFHSILRQSLSAALTGSSSDSYYYSSTIIDDLGLDDIWKKINWRS